MKSCLEVTRLLSEAQERSLSLGERTSLRVHLMICAACRNFGQQMDSLRQISRAYAGGGDARGGDTRAGYDADGGPGHGGSGKPGGKGDCC